jgi:hypothetical protein
MSKAASQTTPVTGSFTIPATATDGATRMRVSMKYNAIPTSCEAFSYGEVEDYTVNLKTVVSTCTNVTLTLTFDNYPEETSWTIKNSGGTTVASGGTYPSQPDGSTINVTNCLAAGTYTFTINDSYGDGICCTYGNGSYTLKDAAGNTLASGSSFTTSKSHTFTIGGTGKEGRGEVYSSEGETTTESYQKILYPNPVKEVLKVRLKEKAIIRSVHILSMSGKSMAVNLIAEKEIDVTSLPSGMYILTVDTTKGLIKEKFVKQ